MGYLEADVAMMTGEVTVIAPSEEEQCCSCRASNVILHKWLDEPLTQGKPTEHQHCDFCFATSAGSACVYKAAFDYETAQIMQHINLVANLLVEKLKK